MTAPRSIELIGRRWVMDDPPWMMPLGKYIALERRVLRRWEMMSEGLYETDWPIIAPEVLAPALSRVEDNGSTTYDMGEIPALQAAMLQASGKQVVAMAKQVLADLQAIAEKYAELYNPAMGPKTEPEFARVNRRWGWDAVLDDLATRGDVVDLEYRTRLYDRPTGEIMALLIRNREKAKAAEDFRKRTERQTNKRHGR